MLLLLASSKCRVAFLSRQVHSVTGTGPLRVLFFGRDQFSCTTFQQLHDAKGGPSSNQSDILAHPTGVDVWTTLDIVTTEDEWIGRNRKTLSVCECTDFCWSFLGLTPPHSSLEDSWDRFRSPRSYSTVRRRQSPQLEGPFMRGDDGPFHSLKLLHRFLSRSTNDRHITF